MVRHTFHSPWQWLGRLIKQIKSDNSREKPYLIKVNAVNILIHDQTMADVGCGDATFVAKAKFCVSCGGCCCLGMCVMQGLVPRKWAMLAAILANGWFLGPVLNQRLINVFILVYGSPANSRSWPIVLMFHQRHIKWTNVKTKFGGRIVFTGGLVQLAVTLSSQLNFCHILLLFRLLKSRNFKDILWLFWKQWRQRKTRLYAGRYNIYLF